MKLIVSIAFILMNYTGFAQTSPAPAGRELHPDSLLKAAQRGEVFTAVQRNPQFPGGNAAFGQYLAANIKYPKNAAKNKIGGTVILTMIVETDGSVAEVKVLRSVDKELDEEAMRVVKASPKWLPAIQNDKPVRVMYNVPINFSAK
ncbi:energy transducer TonB [Mucilaginibacter pedocola]|uniref:TonB C-terminal domain-containing protein n=1 Tax=Mucilaginibacter pedocola TaxID=1792845 RepID=A0A1S9PLM0_9SPHI|nr:energy transducer TonB [Mucilaginibacter pedocola]OOQ61866.1 hypothetical protein BC343_02035 [Mucilaginibacter pedocola]